MFCVFADADTLQPVQVVPHRVGSVNGSSVDMGCPELVNISSDRTACGSCGKFSASYLVDGVSPSINTSRPDWASELVTVQKSERIPGKIEFPHVLFSFGFDMAVLPTSIEVEVFHCPDWNIAAPYLDVQANDDKDLVMGAISDSSFGSSSILDQSCDTLSNVVIDIEQRGEYHSVWYLLVSLTTEDFYDWVHVGEVRFVGLSKANDTSPLCQLSTSSSTMTQTASESTIFPSSTVIGVTPSLSTTVVSEPSKTILVTPSLSGTTSSLLTSSVHVQPTPSLSKDEKPYVTHTPSPSATIPLLFIFIAGGAGIALCLILLVMALCCCAICCYSRSRGHKVKVPLFPYPESFPPDHTSIDLSVPNPLQLSSDEQRPLSVISSEPTYAEIPAEKQQLQVATGSSTDTSCTSFDTPTPGALNSEGETGAVSEAKQPLLLKLPVELQDEEYVSMGASPCHIVSQDVENHLIKHYQKEDIYNEPIIPSDFAGGGVGADGQMFQFLSPVYPTLETMPSGFKATVEVSGENVKEMEEMRVWQFGRTFQAKTLNLSLKAIGFSKTDDRNDLSLLVAIKKFSSRVCLEHEAFIREAMFMSNMNHANVLHFLGVSYQDPTFIMMEYLEEGDLNSFLQKYSEIVPIVTPSNKCQVTISTLVYIASQIAGAMKYLSNLNFIHRDLATRNCFIGANTVVKVGDLGVDMAQYRSHYFPIVGNKLLPIRWMATECFSGVFSEKSDVWAFGVTLWELFTLAKQLPYPHLSDEEVVKNLMNGMSCDFPTRPPACPEPLFEIIEQCWVSDRRQRATFIELHRLLQGHL